MLVKGSKGSSSEAPLAVFANLFNKARGSGKPIERDGVLDFGVQEVFVRLAESASVGNYSEDTPRVWKDSFMERNKASWQLVPDKKLPLEKTDALFLVHYT